MTAIIFFTTEKNMWVEFKKITFRYIKNHNYNKHYNDNNIISYDYSKMFEREKDKNHMNVYKVMYPFSFAGNDKTERMDKQTKILMIKYIEKHLKDYGDLSYTDCNDNGAVGYDTSREMIEYIEGKLSKKQTLTYKPKPKTIPEMLGNSHYFETFVREKLGQDIEKNEVSNEYFRVKHLRLDFDDRDCENNTKIMDIFNEYIPDNKKCLIYSYKGSIFGLIVNKEDFNNYDYLNVDINTDVMNGVLKLPYLLRIDYITKGTVQIIQNILTLAYFV